MEQIDRKGMPADEIEEGKLQMKKRTVINPVSVLRIISPPSCLRSSSRRRENAVETESRPEQEKPGQK